MREKQHEWGRGRERGGERESQAGSMLAAQTPTWVQAQKTMSSWPETKSQMLNWLSHPGTPPLLLLKFFFLSLTSGNLIIMCLSVTLFVFSLFAMVCVLWIWMFISLSRFRKFLTIIALYIPCVPFSFSSRIPIMKILFLFVVSYNFHGLSLFIFFFPSFFLFISLTGSFLMCCLPCHLFFCRVKSTFET